MKEHSYTALWRTLARLSKTDEALVAAEQGRAQALTDLMKERYGPELQPSHFIGVEETISNVASSNSSQAVFVALEGNTIYLWVLCQGNNVLFRSNPVEHGSAISFIEG